MKVSNKILKMLSTNAELRMKVALALGISEQGIIKLVKNNSSNLTKIAAIREIEKETGLNENQILVPTKIK